MHFDDNIDTSTGDKQKPEIMAFYNKTKGGVDTLDKLCGSYNVARNTKRWPMVVFFSMLNVRGFNSQVLYIGNGNKVNSRRSFLRELVRQLTTPQIGRRQLGNKETTEPLIDSVDDNQNPNAKNKNNEETNTNINVAKKRKRCTTCYAKAKRSRLSKYSCIKCKRHVCLEHSIISCTVCGL